MARRSTAGRRPPVKTRDELLSELQGVCEEQDIPLQQVARDLGVAYSTVWDWLHTDRQPSYKNAQALDRWINERKNT